MKQFLALSASAGSGKTFALSARYIALLFMDVQPSSILALTFTNKAANEMKERITSVLNNLHSEPDYLNAIAKELNSSTQTILEHSQKITTRFNDSEINILTIDKFLNKILRSFCWYVGVSQDFNINNDIKEVVQKKFLASLNSDEFDSLIELATIQKKKLNDIFEIFYTLIDKEKELKEFDLKPIEISNSDILKEAFVIKEYYLSVNSSASAKRAVNFNTIEELLILGKSWLAKDLLQDYSYFKKKEIYNSNLEANFTKLKELLKIYLHNKEIAILSRIFELNKKFTQVRLAYKKAHNELDFSDITNYVYSLLQERIDSEFIYYRLDSKIEHMLIDEFQDTSVVQYKILKPLIDEIISGQGASRLKSFFYVGDTKQSIYRFRGGKKELYQHLLTEYEPNGLTKEELNINYRSQSNIIKFVNSTFKYKIDGYFEQNYIEKNIGGYIKYSINEDILEGIKDSINVLLEQNIDPSSIAILSFNNKDIIKISEYLKKNFDFKIATESSMKLISQQSVKSIIELVKYLYFDEDFYKANFLSIMAQDISNKVDVEYQSKESLSHNIYRLAKDYNLLDKFMIRFLEVIGIYKDIHEFIYKIDNLNESVSSKESSSLTLLTIHKSKGLEFKHLIVSDMIANKKGNTQTLIYDYENIDLKRVYYNIKLKEAFDDDYNKALKNEQLLHSTDLINTLYVAFTRAKSSLQIIAKEKASSFAILELVPQEIGELQKENKKEIVINTQKIIDFTFVDYGRQSDFIKKVPNTDSIDFEAINYGLAFHETLEMMDDFEYISLENALHMTNNKYGTILQEKFTLLKNDIDMLLNNSMFQELTSGKISKEYPFIFEKSIKYIDLLVEYDDKIIIIDYKTTTSSHYNQYIEQLLFYKKAITAILKKPVFAYLVFISGIVEFKEVL